MHCEEGCICIVKRDAYGLHTGRQTDRRTDKRTNGQTVKQADRPTDVLTNRYANLGAMAQ